jgi:hypothetical protein
MASRRDGRPDRGQADVSMARRRSRRRDSRRLGSAPARPARCRQAHAQADAKAGLRAEKGWSRISCTPTALPSSTSGFPVTMSRACDRTIGPRIRTRWCDDKSASCSASNHRAPPSASSACMPLSTTHSTFSGILSLARLSGSSDQMRLDNGAVRPPPHEAEPAAPHLGRNGST